MRRAQTGVDGAGTSDPGAPDAPDDRGAASPPRVAIPREPGFPDFLLDVAPASFLRAVRGRETFAWPAAWPASDGGGGEGRVIVKRTAHAGVRDRWSQLWRERSARPAGRREHDNLELLRADGIPVPRAIAWCEARAASPGGARRSLVVMEYVEHEETLRERLLRAAPPERDRWSRELAALVARLHARGWYHRDLYLQHFVIRVVGGREELVLLDVGRARRERRPHRRWFIKDLAALHHSCDAQIAPRERLRFLARYLDLRGVRDVGQRRAWARAIERKRARIAAHVPRNERTESRGDERAEPRGVTVHGMRTTDRPAGERLAIRAPNWVGDLVMATPVLEAAIESPAWSDVRILVRQHLAGILADGPCAERVVVLEKDASEEALYRELRPGAVMLLSNSLGAAWRAFRARVPVRAGAGLSARRTLLTHAVIPPLEDGRRLPIPSAHLMRDVAGLLGVLVPDLHPRLFVRDELVAAQHALLARRGVDPGAGFVLCCPGAAFGAAKLWPPEHFARTLDALFEERGWPAVLSGGAGEEPLMETVARACRHPAVSLANEARDLETLKALVALARLLVVGDSGPRWYAAAFDVPCVSVMGPNFPELTASSLELAAIVRRDDLECSPCLQKVCPLGHHRCLRDLSPDRVVEAALEVLDRPRPVRARESASRVPAARA